MHSDVIGLDALLVDALLQELGGELARPAAKNNPGVAR
jgi:hypothetical protein